MYYNIEEKKKINNNIEFRELFPNIVFPKILTDEIMEEYGYKKVVINQVTPTIFTKVVDSEIEVINGIPTINQTLEYKPIYECKEIALNTIKTKREESICEPINNIQVSTSQDRENIQGAINKFQLITEALNTSTIKWTMADNTESDLTLIDLQNILDRYILRQAQVFAIYQRLKAQIEACTIIEELEAIEI